MATKEEEDKEWKCPECITGIPGTVRLELSENELDTDETPPKFVNPIVTPLMASEAKRLMTLKKPRKLNQLPTISEDVKTNPSG